MAFFHFLFKLFFSKLTVLFLFILLFFFSLVSPSPLLFLPVHQGISGKQGLNIHLAFTPLPKEEIPSLNPT